jgi:hypothetical protein
VVRGEGVDQHRPALALSFAPQHHTARADGELSSDLVPASEQQHRAAEAVAIGRHGGHRVDRRLDRLPVVTGLRPDRHADGNGGQRDAAALISGVGEVRQDIDRVRLAGVGEQAIRQSPIHDLGQVRLIGGGVGRARRRRGVFAAACEDERDRGDTRGRQETA